MKKVFRITLFVLIGIIFIGTIGYLFKKSLKEPEIWETKTAKIDNIVKKTVATGSVVPRQEIEIKPKVNGIISDIYVVPGDYLRKGDLIAKVIIIPDMFQLNEAETRLKKAELKFEDTKIIYERQRKLYEQEIIPEAEFQKYRLEYYNATEELEAAENYLQLTREGVTKKTNETSNTLVRSTIEGMVLDVPVEVGNSVIMANQFNEGTTIAFVADMSEMIFKGKIDETEVGKLKVGMPIKVSIGAIEEQQFDAKLEYIAPKGIEENGAIQFEIEADVNLIDTLFIRAGYSANADIVLERKDSVMVIPESFVKFEKDTDSAFVEILKSNDEEQVFEKQYVRLGLSDGINIEILHGIKLEQEIKTNKKLTAEELKKMKEKENGKKEENSEVVAEDDEDSKTENTNS